MMIKTNFLSRAALPLLAGVLIASPFHFSQASRMSETFSAPQDGVPEGWVVAKRGEEAIAGIHELPGTNGTMGLLLQRPAKNPASAAVYFTGSQGDIVEGRLGDFTVSVTIRFESHSKASSGYYGIIGRATNRNYDKNKGYFVAFQPVGKTPSLGIFHNPLSHVENQEELASVPLSQELKPGVDYILQAQFKGPVIEATLWSTDSAGAKQETLGSVSTDAAVQLEPGYFALRGAFGNSGPQGGYFRSLHISTQEQ